MKIRSVSLAMLVSASAVLMSACVVEPVRPPPPAPVAEVAPPPPAPGYRWARGHYRWAGNHWAWVPGHWVAVY
ncbi:YXWGXW repeat-containing protein [Burkholderia cenocepacia]|uniref:YXWGXW repeat-containing protein n=1 Tax=Burkholderia cenocepacia TaxID=95486 RepID=UPI002652D46D|nr:YXWGXW repeat-containing protein [Burkholderia cenocepacia]MDN7543290.1 YXWGXW repeat-containing protein [Burkholderia cenocepacia]